MDCKKALKTRHFLCKAVGLFVVLAIAATLPPEAASESLTLTTYYPAPYGVYQEFRATRATYLGYNGADGGKGPLDASGNDARVGIGTTSPIMDGTEKDERVYKFIVSGKSNFRNYVHFAETDVGRCTDGPKTKARISWMKFDGTNIHGDQYVDFSQCPSGKYATWFPGVYQEGISRVGFPTPLTVTEDFSRTVIWGFDNDNLYYYCCDKN